MTFNFKLSRLFSKIETRKAAFYFFFTTKVGIACENVRFSSLSAVPQQKRMFSQAKVSTLISVEGG